jgi:hypothetical protein
MSSDLIWMHHMCWGRLVVPNKHRQLVKYIRMPRSRAIWQNVPARLYNRSASPIVYIASMFPRRSYQNVGTSRLLIPVFSPRFVSFRFATFQYILVY